MKQVGSTTRCVTLNIEIKSIQAKLCYSICHKGYNKIQLSIGAESFKQVLYDLGFVECLYGFV